MNVQQQELPRLERAIVSGGQHGGPHSRTVVVPFTLKFNDIFSRQDGRHYFKNIRAVAIMLIVAGEFSDFGGGDGPERLRKLRKPWTHLNVDLVLPQSKWRDLPPEAVRRNLAAGYRACIGRVCEWLRKHDEFIDEKAFVEMFERGMEEFEKFLPELAPSPPDPSLAFFNRLQAHLAQAGVASDDARFWEEMRVFADRELAYGCISSNQHFKMISKLEQAKRKLSKLSPRST